LNLEEYTFSATINGEEHRLLILQPMAGLYKVYWDALYLGNIEPFIHDQLGLFWDTDAIILRGCCQELGEYIESFEP
jgi:hypothetical protein